MNQHLNLFRYFKENETDEFIENNLSRAFAITLQNSNVFLNEYLRLITTEEDYQYLFTSLTSDSIFSVDMQVDIASIEGENYRKIYAVALTANKKIDLSDFFSQTRIEGKSITDIFVTIKDIAFIIEVKRTEEDCKRQLYNQVFPFIENSEKVPIIPVCITWQKIVAILERVRNLEKLTSTESVFVRDFLELSEVRYPYWFEPKPFNFLKFSPHRGTPAYQHLAKRMKQALALSRYSLLGYSDRLGVSVPIKWASELIPEFQSYKDSKEKDFVVFYIWPGNTKSQGYHIYCKPLDWIDKDIIEVDGTKYELEVAFSIKLSHFNRYVSGATFYKNDLIKPICTEENFRNFSGLWHEDRWHDFENFMDNHFKKEFNWRKACDWDEKFKQTDRSYFTMSLGFEVCVFIPYSEFSDLDRVDNDIAKVAAKINAVVDSFEKLI